MRPPVRRRAAGHGPGEAAEADIEHRLAVPGNRTLAQRRQELLLGLATVQWRDQWRDLGLSLLGVTLWTGSFDFTAIVRAQESSWWKLGFATNPLLFLSFVVITRFTARTLRTRQVRPADGRELRRRNGASR